MKLTVLGSGTSVPHASRSAPAFWLDTLAGSLLLDIGPDTAHRMAEEKLDWPNLDAIWVSHFHLDHFGGLAPFLFSMKWAPQTQARTKTLRIAGPEGLRNLLYSINDANNYRLFSQPFNIEVFEIKPSAQFEILPGVAATTMKTPHTKESLALHLKDLDNKTFVYAGDTGYVEELAAFARNVNLLLMECSSEETNLCAHISSLLKLPGWVKLLTQKCWYSHISTRSGTGSMSSVKLTHSARVKLLRLGTV